MAGAISELILMSDVDGTLIERGEMIPPRNVEALERFTQKGGKFAIATGRSIVFCRDLLKILPVNYPCVMLNGGMLYDPLKEEVLDELYLPECAKEYLQELAEVFPNMEMMVVDRDDYHAIKREGDMPERTRSTAYRTRESELRYIIGAHWYKCLVAVEPEIRAEFDRYIEQRKFEGVRFVFANEYMGEMLPERSSKGEALKRLQKVMGFSSENLVAIGDYDNDLEMFRYAGLSATPMGAPDHIKKQAGIVVGDCRNGAVADLIEHLEKLYG